MAFADQAVLDAIVRRRLAKAAPEISHSLDCIAEGNPLASEPSSARLVRRLQTKALLSKEEAEAIAVGVRSQKRATVMAMRVDGEVAAPQAEAIRGATLDFVGVAFLKRGRRAADAVARVAFRNGRPLGSGFVVAPGLFLTNNHVLTSPNVRDLCLEFDYELDEANALKPVTRFALDPNVLYLSDGIDGLDYTLIGIGEQLGGSGSLANYSFIPLSDANDKHALGEVANLVQHPQGRYKELVLRENRLVSRLETEQVLHYIADTEQGSSGSPVFNNEWQVIALHHWGGPHLERKSRDGMLLNGDINEGIRISAIVRDLRAKGRQLTGEGRRRIAEAFGLWSSLPRVGEGTANSSGTSVASVVSGSRINPDGSISWTFPIEINVRAPMTMGNVVGSMSAAASSGGGVPHTNSVSAAFAAERRRDEEDFSDRGGFEPGFLQGFTVPLPRLTRRVKHRPARNLEAGPNDDPNELRYHHFSIVMNADRRLAFFTACNIDGARTKAINRKTKVVIDDPRLSDLDAESISMEGAEASDAFRADPRINMDEQMHREFYEQQVVPGYPDPSSKGRIARMFQKGHIVLRSDPAWGVEEEALAAEADTFFYTNAAPQVGFFNQGSDLKRPGSKGKLRWRAVETYILRNAVAERQRVSVMAGPVFDDENDPSYRQGAKIALKFWKIAVWVDKDQLRSIALLADQSPVLKVMPEAMEGASEQYTDPDELERLDEFFSTVAEIERLTGLDFGAEVRNADVRAGQEQAPAGELDISLLRPTGNSRSRSSDGSKSVAKRRKK